MPERTVVRCSLCHHATHIWRPQTRQVSVDNIRKSQHNVSDKDFLRVGGLTGGCRIPHRSSHKWVWIWVYLASIARLGSGYEPSEADMRFISLKITERNISRVCWRKDNLWLALSPCSLQILNPLCSFHVRKKRTDMAKWPSWFIGFIAFTE